MADLVSQFPPELQQRYLSRPGHADRASSFQPSDRAIEPPPYYANRTVLLTEPQFHALSKFFSAYDDHKHTLFHEIAKSKQTNEGKLYEALIYAWLDRQGIPYTPQPHIEAGQSLKKHAYDADGDTEGCIFDVKMYGISHPNIQRLQARLNDLAKSDKKYSDYYITVSGNLDIGNQVLEELLRNVKDLYRQLFDDAKQIHTDYFLPICDHELELRASYMKNKRIVTTISELDPYKWAMDNQYYFFHHGSQFCHGKPYIIICPYDQKLASSLAMGDPDFANIAFRSLCRRMFMGMPEDLYLHDYDSHAVPMVSLRTASTCISAVIFIDVAMSPDYNDDTWIYLNPNAKNKLPRYVADMFRWQMRGMMEDFSYDTY